MPRTQGSVHRFQGRLGLRYSPERHARLTTTSPAPTAPICHPSPGGPAYAPRPVHTRAHADPRPDARGAPLVASPPPPAVAVAAHAARPARAGASPAGVEVAPHARAGFVNSPCVYERAPARLIRKSLH